jgi:hypothetical protein
MQRRRRGETFIKFLLENLKGDLVVYGEIILKFKQKLGNDLGLTQ